MEQKQIGVKFGRPAKIHYYDAQNFDLQKNDLVVVETSRGIEIAEVVIIKDAPHQEFNYQILRKATQEDLKQNQENYKKVDYFKQKATQHIKNLNLEMKVIDVEFVLDMSKTIITFTAENRVDFRELVRRLAGEFRMKIELRQINPREEVQLFDHIGMCGRPCCCKKLPEREHVSIKMAKTQGLSLNPASISGVCNKLMCCLAYENDEYTKMIEKMPRINCIINTPNGKGKVIFNNIFNNTVKVRFEDCIKDFNLDELSLSEEELSSFSEQEETETQLQQQEETQITLTEQKPTEINPVQEQAEINPVQEENQEPQEDKPANKNPKQRYNKHYKNKSGKYGYKSKKR